MNDIVNAIVLIFEFFSNTQIFGVGLIWWISAPALIGLALSLIAKKGKDENKD